jgi:diguanylate cyclase (GGDEF)-like protein
LGLETVRGQILVFAVVVTLVPSGLMAWVSYVQNRGALHEKISQELLGASAQSAREMDVWLKERLYDLRVFASSYEVSENLARSISGASTKGRLKDYLNSVRERFRDYEELVVLDRQGRTIATSATKARSLTLPPDWSKQLSTNTVLVSEASWDESLKKGIIVIGVPVLRADGKTMGALAARLNLEGAGDGLRSYAPRPAGHMYLLTNTGRVIISSAGNSAALMRLTLRSDLRQRLVRRQGAVVSYQGIMGREVLGSLRQVSRVPWAVLAEIPADVAFHNVQRFRNLTLTIVIGLLLTVTAIAYRFGLLIVRPLERLIRGAAEVADGDLAVDLPVAEGEVGELTSVFNHMVERLRHGRQELDSMNERLRHQNEELEHLSTSDALTGLFNRRFLTQRLSEESLRCYRHKHSFTVLMADVDEFKKYNDTYGHPAGDEVLKRVASILRACTREEDCAARYGGEEFAVLLVDMAGEAAGDVAERIRAKVAGEEFAGRKVTISIGVAEYPEHGYTADAVISRADEALYEAKRGGRNRVVRATAKSIGAKQRR